MTPKENGAAAKEAPFQSKRRHSTTSEHNPIIRARSKPTSMRAAIDAMCAQCMGCSEQMIEPGFRNEIRDCSAPHCPLWLHRPYQVKQTTPREGQFGHRSDLEATFAPGVVPMGGGPT
jgi:hypothetical protein